MRAAGRTRLDAVVLLLLLTLDAALIAADVLCRQGFLADVRFLVTREGGFGEMVQYAKAAVAALRLARFGARQASISSLTWALVLLVVLADDSLAVHERAGVRLAVAWGLQSAGSIRPNQIGELVVLGALGVLCLLALAIGWRFGDERGRHLTSVLLVWFALLGFFAVVLDAVASLARGSAVGPALAVVEDGGELVAMSVLLTHVWRMTRDSLC